MTTPIRIGMMSFDHLHATSYTAALRRTPGVELVGMWHDDPATSHILAERFKLPKFDQADELLAQDLDGVVICSANIHHRRDVARAAGKVSAILCEKPIATTVEDAQAIIDICAATETTLQIAFPVRFHPLFQELKQRLDRGELGRILAVECTNHGSMPGGWFVERALSGGGAVIDHTVHVIDLLRWFWQSEVSEVYAEVGDSLLHPDLGIDDAGMLSFQLENGIYGTLDTSWSRPASYPTWGDVKIEVIGDKGVALADMSRQHVAVSANRAGKTQWAPYGGDMDLGLIQDFIAMIREDRAPSITGEDGLRALAVALAAYESAAAGKPVSPA